jgi:endonuclease/exonuclease/phosphatase family metal-dependent hydrolase
MEPLPAESARFSGQIHLMALAIQSTGAIRKRAARMTVSMIRTRDETLSSLRLYTHNIFGNHAGWHQRRELLAAGIRELSPDLIFLQETVVTEAEDQVAEFLDPTYHVVHSSTRSEDGYGISLASRWPITETYELDLKVASERTFDFACTTLIAEIEAPQPIGRVLAANHFPDYHTDHEIERERQAVIAARALADLATVRPAHVLLAGDLDAEADSGSLRFLAGKQSLDGLSVCYRNAWDSVHPGEPGHTFTGINPLVPSSWPFKRIDHIFIQCGSNDMPTLDIAACELAFDQPIDGVWASDHFGVIADFTPRANE